MDLIRVLRDLSIIDGRIGVVPMSARKGGWPMHLTANQWRAFDRLLPARTNPAILSRLFLHTLVEGIGEPPWGDLLVDAADVMVPLWDALLFETGLEWPEGEDGYHYVGPLNRVAERASVGLRSDHRVLIAQRLLARRVGVASDQVPKPDEFTELAERLVGVSSDRIPGLRLEKELVARRDAHASILRSGDIESVIARLESLRVEAPADAACLAVYLTRGWRVESLTGEEASAAGLRLPVVGDWQSVACVRTTVRSPLDPRLTRWLADAMPDVAFLHGLDIGGHTAEDLQEADRIVQDLLDRHPEWMPKLERSLGG